MSNRHRLISLFIVAVKPDMMPRVQIPHRPLPPGTHEVPNLRILFRSQPEQNIKFFREPGATIAFGNHADPATDDPCKDDLRGGFATKTGDSGYLEGNGSGVESIDDYSSERSAHRWVF